MINNDIITIGDTQVHEDTPTDHLEALSRYIWHHKPGTIVHIGDNWDFPSLSSYGSAKEMEGQKLVDDLKSGADALKLVMSVTKEKNRSDKKRAYKPELHFVAGNHENRLARFLDKNPVLHGMVDLEGSIRKQGWEYHGFLEPYWGRGNICFIHFLPASESSRPIGGAITNKLNKIPHSFVHGHQQQFQYGRRQNMLGRPHFGVCAGSFYMHDEGYRGCNNTEIRGFTHLRAYENRYGHLDHDVEFVSLERLMQAY